MTAFKIKKKIKLDFENSVSLVSFNEVHTVCEESKCPNRYECSSNHTATFLIAGDICTRNCAFCNVKTGRPLPLEETREKEMEAVIEAVKKTNMKYVVLTSVTRDDDEEGLAGYFALLTRKLKELGCMVEMLIPDFHSNEKYLEIILNAKPNVIAHNIETVSKYSKSIRPQAAYITSLATLHKIKEIDDAMITKSSFLAGLGESFDEINQLMVDLKNAGVNIFMIGQYLRPSAKQTEVKKIYDEKEFTRLQKMANQAQFDHVEAGTFVRSSYRAHEVYLKLLEKK